MLGGMISICFTSLQKSINVIRYLQGKKILCQAQEQPITSMLQWKELVLTEILHGQWLHR